MRARRLAPLLLAALSASSASSPPDATAALAAAKALASRAAEDFAAGAADEGAEMAAWLRAGAGAAEETHQMAETDARARYGRLAARLRVLECAGAALLVARLSAQEQAFRARDPPPAAEGLRLFHALRLAEVSSDIAALAAAHARTAERIAQSARALESAPGRVAALRAQHAAAAGSQSARVEDAIDGAVAARRQHAADVVAAAYLRSILAAAQRYRAHVDGILEALASGPGP